MFYEPNLTFQQAESLILSEICEVEASCYNWAHTMSTNEFRAFAHDKKTAIVRKCSMMCSLAELFHHGREG